MNTTCLIQSFPPFVASAVAATLIMGVEFVLGHGMRWITRGRTSGTPFFGYMVVTPPFLGLALLSSRLCFDAQRTTLAPVAPWLLLVPFVGMVFSFSVCFLWGKLFTKPPGAPLHHEPGDRWLLPVLHASLWVFLWVALGLELVWLENYYRSTPVP